MADLPETIAFGRWVRVSRWVDPATEEVGHDARSEYVERFWLPVLGPSTTCLLRHLAARLARSPAGCMLDVAETARALGLGERPGRHAPFMRTLARAADFGMIRVDPPDGLATRVRLPPLSARHLSRLPSSLRAAHRLAAGSTGEVDPADRLRDRGRQLALSLASIGAGRDEIEHQLLSWRFDRPLAEACAAWAASEAVGNRFAPCPAEAVH
ncbi:MAG: hypothetical protein ABSC73_05950 [Acidimicrobiales bacterium]